MRIEDLNAVLGYDASSNYLTRRTGLETAQMFGHIFRAAQGRPGLIGVYTLRPDDSRKSPIVPVVYVCQVKNDADADEAHRLVWNQDVVPFILINTPTTVRLYSGFRHDTRRQGSGAGLLRELHSKHELVELAEGFSAAAIDDGELWRKWGKEVRREERVDWQLLENLRRLDKWLREVEKLDSAISHALIGKYVYLHYLRDRDILSDRKLSAWDIERQSVFGRNATLSGLRAVVDRVDDWLNGDVFPLKLSGRDAPSERQLQRVAATFLGDEPLDDGSWQLHLDFRAYDFSYIPIETLSVVYEQFLHAADGNESEDANEGQTRGRQAGAYYTPIPVVNFMLAELDDRRPLEQGMTVFDPSCGSGAFLVQCYRQLIERTFPPRKGAHKPTPTNLRDVLEKHIFGVDRDPDACRVTELSLMLTLLDYVEPPDLERNRNFKLPLLRDRNIFCSDLFDPRLQASSLASKRFDWVVGNPPWKKLNPAKLKPEDTSAWKRMQKLQAEARPVGSHQLAQVFVWEVERYLAPAGEAALLIPAMTLFEDPSSGHRAKLFEHYRVHAVANFANLAEVLFAGRSRVPAAAIFFRIRKKDEVSCDDETVSAYSPLVANQEPTRPVVIGRRNKIWSLVLNASEVRTIPVMQVSTGSGLPWKLAVWGSEHDLRLLSRLRKRFGRLRSLEKKDVLIVAEGPQLRSEPKDGERSLEQKKSLVGKPGLNTKKLARLRHFFTFPDDALDRNSCSYVRRGHGEGLQVCEPPHVIVSAARNFAIFSDDFLLVPPRQIGIASPTRDSAFLRAISLFLSSDFAYYHQFLTSTELGVKRDRATLAALREMPVPVEAIRQDLKAWTELHGRLVKTSKRGLKQIEDDEPNLFTMSGAEVPSDYQDLLNELNTLTSRALGLDGRDVALIEDLVRVRLQLNDGKLGHLAVDPPRMPELRRYAKRLKEELDSFVGDEVKEQHDVDVVYDSVSGIVQVDFTESPGRADQISVVPATRSEAAALTKARAAIRRKHSQWVYFDRNLRVFDGRRAYFLKPMQRFQWTESQAMNDASEIIAATVGQEAPA